MQKNKEEEHAAGDRRLASVQEDRYGIGVIRACRAHEQELSRRFAAGEDPTELLAWHQVKIAWLQHERLVHLIVLCLTIAVTLFSLSLALACSFYSVGAVLVTLILLVLTGFYVVHYFRLENTCQHWYHLADQLHDASRQGGFVDGKARPK